jgi:ankyrin repeat protein
MKKIHYNLCWSLLAGFGVLTSLLGACTTANKTETPIDKLMIEEAYCAGEGGVFLAETLKKLQAGNNSAVDNPNEADLNRTALHYATSLGATRILDVLIKCGADVNKKDLDEWTPLHYAVNYNKIAAAKTLLAASGIDVNATTKEGNTPLHLAANAGKVQMVKTLLEATGIEVNKKNKNGSTPLAVAGGSAGEKAEIEKAIKAKGGTL